MLKFYSNSLIGYQETGVSTFGLYGQDTYEVYQKNLQTHPQDWIYTNKTVEYDRNSCGHRSKEIDQLDNKFILFIGCSITVGSAVALEDTFPYLVSKYLNIDYYNLAVEGSGPDLLAQNLANWISKIKKIPVAVVIQWPEIARTFRQDNTTVVPLGPWSCKQHIGNSISKQQWLDYEKLIVTDYFEHTYNILRNSVLALLESHNIKVIEIENITTVDYGRDLKHPGIQSHQLVADTVVSALNIAINFGQ